MVISTVYLPLIDPDSPDTSPQVFYNYQLPSGQEAVSFGSSQLSAQQLLLFNAEVGGDAMLHRGKRCPLQQQDLNSCVSINFLVHWA